MLLHLMRYRAHFLLNAKLNANLKANLRINEQPTTTTQLNSTRQAMAMHNNRVASVAPSMFMDGVANVGSIGIGDGIANVSADLIVHVSLLKAFVQGVSVQVC